MAKTPQPPLISVIVPACDAEATLGETIASALDQTVKDIEVLVIDDGSADSTHHVASAFAAKDDRVRVLRQENGGVARARNFGLQQARGRLIAPLDADDLWHPQKLALQLEALDRTPGAALAYNWSRIIDGQGRVIGSGPCARFEGRVLHRHIMWNFIANGSTPLVAAEVLRQVGYESVLRDSGRQGAEDYLMQLLVAKDHAFACAPAYLTGYRWLPSAMSRDTAQMFESTAMAFEIVSDQVAGLPRRLCRARRVSVLNLSARERFSQGRYADGAAHVWSAIRDDAPAILARMAKPRSVTPRTHDTPSATPGEVFFRHDPWADAPCEPPIAFVGVEEDLERADRRLESP